jgi:hypothetical protein
VGTTIAAETVLGAALDYQAQSLAVIPVRPRDKKPLLPWKGFQERRATDLELRTWWRRWPDAGVGVVCGAVSGVIVVDGDPRNGLALADLVGRLPVTPTVETGGGGLHLYFARPPGLVIPKIAGLLPGLDLQGEGSYVVAPPSVHPNGQLYRWSPARALGDTPLAPLPGPIRQLLRLHRQQEWARDTGVGRVRRVGRLTVDATLSALAGVRRRNAGWVARCPAHDDREPSLSVGVGGDGELLLHCFRGCAFEAVVAAFGRARRETV